MTKTQIRKSRSELPFKQADIVIKDSNGMKGKQMLRKALIIAFMIVIGLGGFDCKKSSSDEAATQEQVKTTAEYEAEAKQEINKENRNQELDKMEQELAQEANQPQ
jgi:hypothetical protein